MRIGLISDTHGLLRPEALDALAGCAHIVHGGDIGDEAILDALRKLAPVSAVRGNNDREAWARALPAADLVEVDGAHVYVVHDLADLAIEPRAAGVVAVVSGHSHVPRVEARDGVLYVNPGSAGPRRFRLPVTVGELTIVRGRATARIVPLSVGRPG